MSDLAPSLQAFFIDRLGQQRAASPHTVAAYRDTFRMLLTFCHERTGRTPSKLRFDNLDAELIAAFLEHARDRSRQQRPHPQRPPRRHPLVLPVRRPPSP